MELPEAMEVVETQGLLDLLVQLGPEVRQVHLEREGLMEHLVTRDLEEKLDLQALLDQLDHQDPLAQEESLEHEEKLDLKVLLAQEVKTEIEVKMDNKDLQVLLDLQGPQVLLGSGASLAH